MDVTITTSLKLLNIIVVIIIFSLDSYPYLQLVLYSMFSTLFWLPSKIIIVFLNLETSFSYTCAKVW